MTKDEIIKLAERVVSGTASQDELVLYNRMYNSQQLAQESADSFEEDELALQIKGAIDKKIFAPKQVIKMHFLRYASAAAVIIFLAAISYFLFLEKRPGQETATNTIPSPEQTQIVPGKDGAILKLANGKTIVLEHAGNGKLTEQAEKVNDILSYRNASKTIVEYNTLTTPNGRQFTLLLADGSKVWLNAASSIRFPTAFTANDRRVQITGEAYFEVAHDASKKFLVDANGIVTEVLGTHFNVNSYADESEVKITLLQGSIKVMKGVAADVLKPGQQAQIGQEIIVHNSVNTESVMAWKNGLFSFSNTDLKTLMRQVARWYDIQIEYQGKTQQRLFGGEISRGTSLQQLRSILEESNIKCRLYGRKLVVE